MGAISSSRALLGLNPLTTPDNNITGQNRIIIIEANNGHTTYTTKITTRIIIFQESQKNYDYFCYQPELKGGTQKLKFLAKKFLKDIQPMSAPVTASFNLGIAQNPRYISPSTTSSRSGSIMGSSPESVVAAPVLKPKQSKSRNGTRNCPYLHPFLIFL